MRSDRRIGDPPAPRLCPDPEVLAAFIDQGLGAAEREQIEAHLAGCDDCRMLVAHVLETRDAVVGPEMAASRMPFGSGPSRDAERLVLAPPRAQWLRWGGVGALVAAAAVLLAAVIAPPSWWPRGRPGGDDPRLADLAVSVRERTVEARLTGGFRHGPLRAPVRSGGSLAPTDNWKLYAAAGRIREDAERNPSAPNLHALGLAHLVLGDPSAAIQAFEDAVAADSRNPRYLSDLSAAYLTRARQLDRADDWPRAFAAAERAVAADASQLEARFNRALALEGLALEQQARQAWSEYLALDSSSPWADEARAHLAELQRVAAEIDRARNNSPPDIIDQTAEAGLDWLLRNGLPAWASAVLGAETERAARERLALLQYAERIATVTGDGFARALAADGTDGAARILDVARALARLDSDDWAGARAELVKACRSARDPIALVCDVEQGAIDVQRGDMAGAERRAVQAMSRARAAGFTYVVGRAARLAGYRHLFQSNHSQALEDYQAAYEAFTSAKYLAQAGAVASQIAELFEFTGLATEAWRWRLRALQQSAHARSLPLEHLVATSAAWSFRSLGLQEAARLFAMVDPAKVDSVRALPRVVEYARVALATADVAAARQAVTAARQLVERSGDFRSARTRPDVLAVTAAVEAAEGNVQQADATFSEAIAAMGPDRAVHQASALLERVRLRAVSLNNLAGAEDDLRKAIALLSVRQIPPQQLVTLKDAGTAFSAAATLISLQPHLQNTSGLLLIEQLHELVDAVPPPLRLVSLEALDDRLRAGERSAVVVFAFTESSLLTWVGHAGGVQFLERPVTRSSIDGLAAVLAVQLARGSTQEELWRDTLSQLYDATLSGLPGLADASSLLVVADGPLHRVPFGSLFDKRSGKYLFETADVRVASNLVFGSPEPAVGPAASILSIGEPAVTSVDPRLPPLPRARAEAELVGSIYPRQWVLVGELATKDQVLARLGDADVIHFAGHATLPATGIGPSLLLSGAASDPRNMLSARDVGVNRRHARVVLAACDTAARPTDRGTGGGSLASAFLQAGAASVVGTLWKLDDTAGEEFFVTVHRAIARGLTNAAAVAGAQRACRASERCRASAATWIGATVYGHH